MNHQTFKEWLLFSKDEAANMLTSDQIAQVENHKRTCSSCRKLVNAWNQVENQLQQSPVLSPSFGFSTRWQNRLQIDRQKRYERQTIRVLVLGVVLMVAFLTLFVFLLLPWFLDPEALIWASIYRITSLAINIEAIINLFLKFTQSVNMANPILPWWLFTIGLSCELGVLWIVSYQYLIKQRRIIR
jgi:hypothetical protein